MYVPPVLSIHPTYINIPSISQETQRKLRTAQSSMAESEHSQERRLKIMRKTHQSALALKEALIQELKDMLCEQEEQIRQLEASLRGDIPTSPIKVGRNKRPFTCFCITA